MSSISTSPPLKKFQFCIDRGGTFTDVHCILPDGQHVVSKLLSEDPAHYPDAPTEGIRRILEEYSPLKASSSSSSSLYSRGIPIPTSEIASIRMGTTVATNALLERQGSPLALLITKGFADLLEIGNQARPNIFDLTCSKPSLLYQTVVSVDERVVLNQFYETDTNADDAADAADAEESTVIVKGLTGEYVRVLKTPDLEQIRHDLLKLKDDGIEALAICLMHSYTYPDHEIMIGKIAQEIGFQQISLSSQVMPMVKLVSRYVSLFCIGVFSSLQNQTYDLPPVHPRNLSSRLPLSPSTPIHFIIHNGCNQSAHCMCSSVPNAQDYRLPQWFPFWL